MHTFADICVRTPDSLYIYAFLHVCANASKRLCECGVIGVWETGCVGVCECARARARAIVFVCVRACVRTCIHARTFSTLSKRYVRLID